MMKTNKFKVESMSCASCKAHVENAVNSLNGVNSCSVNLLTNSMEVSYEDSLSTSQIIKAVKKAGYNAYVDNSKNILIKNNDKETKQLIFRLVASLILLVPLFYLAMGYMLNWPIFSLDKNLILLATLQLIFSSLIIAINNKFFVSGSKALFHGGPNMDTLVMLGTGVSYIYSIVIYILMCINKENSNYLMHLSMNLSFETAGMVPSLITIGKTLESISKGKTTNAIKGLLELAPKTAHKIENGKEVTINSSELEVDDLFLVKPGEYFPADGTILSGLSSVDESSLSGEPLPIDKKEGDYVKTGTINLYGALTCKANKVGDETTLNQIIKMVETASGTKTKISRIADKVSAFFVPTVIIISIIVFVCWILLGNNFVEQNNIEQSLLSYSINKAISVLVISCPCALGLATPVAIMVASGLGAKRGILFKSAATLEECGKIQIIALDKTGTITMGKPYVNKIILNKNADECELLKIAYSLESKSEHPLAKAIVIYCENNNAILDNVDNFKSLIGKGVYGEISGKKVYGCSESYLEELHIKNTLKNEIVSYIDQGKTALYFVREHSLLGAIIVEDKIKEDSIKAIKKLQNLGLEVVMLTGDTYKSAKNIAKQIGITNFVSNVLPDQKLEIISKLQKYGKVMMVGDGINDAPSLSKADVGVSIASGSDIAIDSADIVLTKNSLLDVYGAIRLSQKTLLNIKENLFWAFIYNIIMIPIAAGAFAPFGLTKLMPWMGAAAMSLSSVCVVINALRINLIDIYKERKIQTKKININMDDLLNNKIEDVTKKSIRIEGMMCEHCQNRVKNALLNIDGINEVSVSLVDKCATITCSKNIDNKIIEKAIIDAGYKINNK